MKIIGGIFIQCRIFTLISVCNQIFLEPIETDKIKVLIVSFVIKLYLLVDNPLYCVFTVVKLRKIKISAAQRPEILFTVAGIKYCEYNARFSFGIAELLLSFAKRNLKCIDVGSLAEGIVYIGFPVDSLCRIVCIQLR